MSHLTLAVRDKFEICLLPLLLLKCMYLERCFSQSLDNDLCRPVTTSNGIYCIELETINIYLLYLSIHFKYRLSCCNCNCKDSKIELCVQAIESVFTAL